MLKSIPRFSNLPLITASNLTVLSAIASVYSYNLKVLDINKDKYNTYTTIKNNNVNILIEPISEIYLIGTTIDYVSEDFKNNIFENKFIFIPNKNIATSCGCGVSFNPKI